MTILDSDWWIVSCGVVCQFGVQIFHHVDGGLVKWFICYIVLNCWWALTLLDSRTVIIKLIGKWINTGCIASPLFQYIWSFVWILSEKPFWISCIINQSCLVTLCNFLSKFSESLRHLLRWFTEFCFKFDFLINWKVFPWSSAVTSCWAALHSHNKRLSSLLVVIKTCCHLIHITILAWSEIFDIILKITDSGCQNCFLTLSYMKNSFSSCIFKCLSNLLGLLRLCNLKSILLQFLDSILDFLVINCDLDSGGCWSEN